MANGALKSMAIDRPAVPGAGHASVSSPVVLTLTLCAFAALVEGFDTQAMGVAGPALIREFALSPAVSGWLFSGGTLGQAIGSTIGGRLADRIGRKWALIASLLLIGACSLGTVVSPSVSGLFVTRLLAGLGLGGALPNFITLAAETVRPERRLRIVTLLMAALPIGGTIASITALANGIGLGWRTIFIVGGLVPLILGLLAVWTAAERTPRLGGGEASSSSPAEPSHEPLLSILFGRGQAPTTLLLWVSFFFTQLILLLMLNWLPTLVVRSGFSESQASWTQVCFSVCGALGSYVVGRLQSGDRRRAGIAATYLGIAISLGAAGLAQHVFAAVLLASAAAGVFIIGAQLALYGVSPLYYARPVRASGVGGAAAIGRLGSVVGPLFAGALLAGGGSASAVLLGIEPFVLVGGAAAFALGWRPQARD